MFSVQQKIVQSDISEKTRLGIFVWSVQQHPKHKNDFFFFFSPAVNLAKQAEEESLLCPDGPLQYCNKGHLLPALGSLQQGQRNQQFLCIFRKM